MVRSSTHQPLHRKLTPFLCFGILVVAYEYEFFLPTLIVILVLFTYLYGFRNPWPSEKEEMSAYSLFNPNLEELPGTLNAARIDRELRGTYNTSSINHHHTKQPPTGKDSHSWGKGNKLS